MKPDELRELLLSGRSFESVYASIPEDTRALSISSFRDEAKKSAKHGRVVRRIFLAGLFAYFWVFGREELSDFLIFFFALAAYEFAYGHVAQVRADLEDKQARERYRLRVDEYLKTKFRGYTPPSDELTIFSVSTSMSDHF